MHKNFYDVEENVNEYLKMCEGYKSDFIVERMGENLKRESSILELGSGSGKDLEALSKFYNITGSDSSEIFIKYLKKKVPGVEVIKLNAINLNISKRYDCIFSNKVLMHLNKYDIPVSILNQYKHLEPNGMIFHTFWYGQGEDEFDGLRFIYYNEELLTTLFGSIFDITMERYSEDDENDSIYLIGRKR